MMSNGTGRAFTPPSDRCAWGRMAVYDLHILVNGSREPLEADRRVMSTLAFCSMLVTARVRYVSIAHYIIPWNVIYTLRYVLCSSVAQVPPIPDVEVAVEPMVEDVALAHKVWHKALEGLQRLKSNHKKRGARWVPIALCSSFSLVLLFLHVGHIHNINQTGKALGTYQYDIVILVFSQVRGG